MAQRFGNNLKAIKIDVAAASKRGVLRDKREADIKQQRRGAQPVGGARYKTYDSNLAVQVEDKAPSFR